MMESWQTVTWSGTRCELGLRRKRLARGGFHRFLNLLESPDLDLANALAGDTELLRQIFQGDGIIAQTTSLEYAPLAIIELLDGLSQHIMAHGGFFALGQNLLLVVGLVDEPV